MGLKVVRHVLVSNAADIEGVGICRTNHQLTYEPTSKIFIRNVTQICIHFFLNNLTISEGVIKLLTERFDNALSNGQVCVCVFQRVDF